MKTATKKKPVAFDFVLEELHSLEPTVKPMFGSHAVYVKERIVLILRNRDSHRGDNGVWIATGREHHESLRKEFPGMRAISIFGFESEWQNLPASSDDFEEEVMKICRCILRGDPRIGKIPKRRQKKSN